MELEIGTSKTRIPLIGASQSIQPIYFKGELTEDTGIRGRWVHDPAESDLMQ